ncbi:hypothetical protein O9992_21045 [Vibrio lentus]|nr:hypothetical protein [Vibrio lentus]
MKSLLLRVATDEKRSSGALDSTSLQKNFYVGTLPSFGSSSMRTSMVAALCLASGILPLPWHFDYSRLDIPSLILKAPKLPITINVSATKPLQSDDGG